MPAWKFGALIVMGAEIPVWAEALEAQLKMWIQLRLRADSVMAVTLKLRSVGFQLAGLCWSHTCSYPCRSQAGRGSWPPEKPWDGRGPAAGGCWGGQHLGGTSGWQMGSALKVVCKMQQAQVAGPCQSLRLLYSPHVATLTIAFLQVCLFSPSVPPMPGPDHREWG